tara:strand:- start:806 stop:1072 length:267 start_codon:yes stop_codon:yes gene_type:complete
MKVGSLIKCVREQHQFFGVIVKVHVAPDPERIMEDTECSDCRGETSNEWFEDADNCESTWAEIQWADGHQTWEEWEVSIEDGCFEVVG